MNELAAVVAAETASSCLDYALLKELNQLAQKRYADMANFVKGLQPQMEVRWLLTEANAFAELHQQCCANKAMYASPPTT